MTSKRSGEFSQGEGLKNSWAKSSSLSLFTTIGKEAEESTDTDRRTDSSGCLGAHSRPWMPVRDRVPAKPPDQHHIGHEQFNKCVDNRTVLEFSQGLVPRLSWMPCVLVAQVRDRSVQIMFTFGPLFTEWQRQGIWESAAFLFLFFVQTQSWCTKNSLISVEVEIVRNISLVRPARVRDDSSRSPQSPSEKF